ncbi:MAG: AAA family ATPase, partial [Prochloraceae cyanobacterium]|nr:AAA family ATPase [Prochloraceae cyanobacterium]
KLLAKNAEDRYQSSLGLKYDLETCLEQICSGGKIGEFSLGKRDRSDRPLVPEKLYGREKEIDLILAAFARVKQNQSEIIFISGYSGIGKTALVKEIYQVITESKGYFIEGKFDQFKKDIPYSAFINAFGDLLSQILTETTTKIAIWRDRLLAALEPNGRIITDLIPELELIIGRQPPVAKLESSAAQNRFNLLFKKFINIFCSREHPLVLFLDDLQWADLASLDLIELIITAENGRHLLLIGSYRDREIHPAHYLNTIKEKITNKSIKLNEISLAPLNISSVTELIADTLRQNSQDPQLARLAKLLYNQSQGNPFALNQIIEYIYKEKILRYDYQRDRWEWELQKIKDIGIFDRNLVDLIITNIQKLPLKTQKVLQIAACIGNKFNLETLAIINRENPLSLAKSLWKALEVGLIFPLSTEYNLPLESSSSETVKDVRVEYRFLHDRIQQAAYILIEQQEKERVHLSLGRLLLKNLNSDNKEENIFEIVNHLNIGSRLLNTNAEKKQLARLNLKAGKQAKVANAYIIACKYLSTGIQLLSTDSWKNEYQLTFKLHLEAAETACFLGDFQQMESFCAIALKSVNNQLDRIAIYQIEIAANIARDRFKPAIELGLSILKELDITIDPINFQTQSKKLDLVSSELEINSWIDLPTMTNPYKLAAMKILETLVSACYFGAPQMLPSITIQQVNLSIEYGNTSMSCISYAAYGMMLCGEINNIERGYFFGQLAFKLLEKFKAKKYKAKILAMVNGYTFHWKSHIRKTLPSLSIGYHSGIENGDLEYGFYCLINYYFHGFLVGKNLIKLADKIAKDCTIIPEKQYEISYYALIICRQAILNLLDRAENPCQLIGESCDERIIIATKKRRFITLHFYKLILNYLFGDCFEAWENLTIVESLMLASKAMVYTPLIYFYKSLIEISLLEFEDEATSILARIEERQKSLKICARSAPMNYLHKYYLVAAELNRVKGNKSEAIESYDRAIALARENEYLNDEALALELAAKFYLQWDKEKIASIYMLDAYYAYNRWGATAKVNDLRESYPNLLASIINLEESKRSSIADSISTRTVTSNSSDSSVILDLEAVLKSSQAIAKEVQLQQLISTLMKVTIESAGASEGFIILEKQDNLYIEGAECFDRKQLGLNLPQLIDNDTELPLSIINYITRTKENLVLENASKSKKFNRDRYILKYKPKSILCAPIMYQGKFIGLLYLENNLTIGAFTRDRLELLKVIASQAAISLENAKLYETLEEKVKERTKELSQTLEILKATQAELVIENNLLKSAEDFSNFNYQVGGSLPVESPTYVVRQADRYLYKALKLGEFCYILNARQMGKSSLQVQTINRLQQEGIQCTAIDLSAIGNQNITIEQWYAGFIYTLAGNLNLLDRLNIISWWKERKILSPVQRLAEFIREVILTEISDNLAIFLDEIDSILALDFAMDDFFIWLRSCYNQRAYHPKFKRLTFILIGCASPSELIQNQNITPFNIGQAIQLYGFKEHEAQPLLGGLQNKSDRPRTVLKEILAWTNGQPFLTQKICKIIQLESLKISANQEAECVAELVKTKIIDNWQYQDEPEHLKTIQNRLLNITSNPIILLKLYQKILEGETVIDNNSIEIKELLLSGLVIKQQGKLTINNRIYQTIFDRNWLQQTLQELS